MVGPITCTTVTAATTFCLDIIRNSAVAESDAGEEGLSEYAMDTIPEDLLQQAESDQGMGFEGTNRAWVSLNNPDPVVVETLQGLAKVVANRHIPRVQGWLKVLVKVTIQPHCTVPCQVHALFITLSHPVYVQMVLCSCGRKIGWIWVLSPQELHKVGLLQTSQQQSFIAQDN